MGDRGLTLCFGTRPQVIKSSALLGPLRERWPITAADAGQHYDFELNELLYRQLDIPEPDHFLEVGSSTPVQQTADVIGGDKDEGTAAQELKDRKKNGDLDVFKLLAQLEKSISEKDKKVLEQIKESDKKDGGIGKKISGDGF